MNFLSLFMNAILPVLGTILSGLVTWGAAAGTNYVRQKTKNEAAVNAMERISHTAQTVVDNLNQTLVPAMKEAAEDGRLSSDDIARLKNTALNNVKSQVPEAVQTAATLAVNSVRDLISAKIEQAVGKAKKELP
jgi:hypothetical protein